MKKNREETKVLSSLGSEKFEGIKWDPEEPKYLFLYENHLIKRFNIDTGVSDSDFFEGVNGFGFFNKNLYVLTNHFSFIKTDFSHKHEEIILNDPVLYKNLFPESEPYHLKVLAEDLIVFTSARGALTGNRLPYHFVDEGVLGTVFEEKRQKLLVYTKEKIGILDFSRQVEDVKVFEKGPPMSWVYAQGESIHAAYWVYDGEHVLFQDGDQISLLEFVPTSGYILTPLIEVKKGSAVMYEDLFGKLYYLNRQSGQLESLEIIPRRNIPIWEIPELEFAPDHMLDQKEKK